MLFRLMSGAAVGWLALSVGACFPTPGHGPRVEPGFRFGGSGSLPTVVRRYDTGLFGSGPFDLPTFGGSLAYGWRGSDDLPALRVGNEFMVPTVSLVPDIYVQFPKLWSRSLDAGVGATAVLGLGLAGSQLIYFQAGAKSDGGRGFYVTQGFVREDLDGQSSANERLRDDGWLASIAYQWRHRRVDWQLFLAGVRGRPFRQDCSSNPFVDCRGFRRPYAAFVGLTLEVSHLP